MADRRVLSDEALEEFVKRAQRLERMGLSEVKAAVQMGVSRSCLRERLRRWKEKTNPHG
jgi:transposase